MPTPRRGFVDAYHSSRLNHLTGTTYPAAPVTLYLGLFAGKLADSSGAGGTEISPATRPTLTLGTTQTDPNNRQYITNGSAITGIVLTNTSLAEVIGFGVFAANSGGSPIYVDTLPSPFQVAAGATITIPANAIKIFAEPPTI